MRAQRMLARVATTFESPSPPPSVHMVCHRSAHDPAQLGNVPLPTASE